MMPVPSWLLSVEHSGSGGPLDRGYYFTSNDCVFGDHDFRKGVRSLEAHGDTVVFREKTHRIWAIVALPTPSSDLHYTPAR